nr:MAG TPA: hypothetical protein [Caudoviricetes sp.]
MKADSYNKKAVRSKVMTARYAKTKAILKK